MDTVTAFTRWTPPGVLRAVFDYPARITKHRDLGFLDDSDHAALQHLLATVSRDGMSWQPNRGDPVPPNLLLPRDGGCGLVGFEFTGLYLPGLDLALLHTVLAATPGVSARERRRRRSPGRTATTRPVGTAVPAVGGVPVTPARRPRCHVVRLSSRPGSRRSTSSLSRPWWNTRLAGRASSRASSPTATDRGRVRHCRRLHTRGGERLLGEALPECPASCSPPRSVSCGPTPKPGCRSDPPSTCADQLARPNAAHATAIGS